MVLHQEQGILAGLVGDKVMTEINRQDALESCNGWVERLKPKKGKRPRGANTANRNIGNLRLLHERYFRHIGQEERQNPFRNLNFRETVKKEVPPFADTWVRGEDSGA